MKSEGAPARRPAASLDGLSLEYTSRGLLEVDSYDARILKSIRENPELDLARNDGVVVEEYFDRLSAEYRRELEELVRDTPALGASTKLSIAIPAYKEGPNIHRTLEGYATLDNPRAFEVVVLENHPKGVERDNTEAEIARFKSAHPQVQVAHLYKQFDEKCIGRVRKYLNDAILERKRQAGRADPLLMTSNDADLEEISPRYASILIDTFARDPHLDGVRGGIDHPPNAFARFPLMHATLRFLSYFNMIQRRLRGGAVLNGRNATVRSGIYAAIGGYNERAIVGEDMEIGRLIVHARHGDTTRLRYVHTAWIHSNPRREMESVLSGVPVIRRYDGFVSNERVYDVPVQELLDQGKDFSPEQFAVELQAIYDHYKARSQDGVFMEAFDRAMRFIRIDYHIAEDRVVIDDLSRLEQDLGTYQERMAA